MGTGQTVREWVAVPEKGYRVARCLKCGTGFTWKHADQIGCPDCGTASLTTSTRQRKAGFYIVAGDELTAARVVGLASTVRFERKYAGSMYENAGRLIMNENMVIDENGYTRDTTSEYGGGYKLEALIEGAGKRMDKAARLERKAAKLAAQAKAALQEVS